MRLALVALVVALLAAVTPSALAGSEVEDALPKLASTSEAVRDEARAKLRDLLARRPDETAELIARALDLRRRTPYEEEATALLVEAGDPVIEALLRSVGQRSFENAAGRVLRRIGAPAIPRALAHLGRGADVAECGLAGQGLVAIGPPALPATLGALGRHRAGAARRWLVWALGRLGDGSPAAVAALAAVLDAEEGERDGGESFETRAEAVRSLGRVGASAATETALAALERTAVSDARGTRLQVEAVRALAKVAGGGALDALLHVVSPGPRDRVRGREVAAEVRWEVVETIVALRSLDTARLVERAGDRDGRVQAVALQAIGRTTGRVRSPAVDAAVRAGLRSQDGDARAAAEEVAAKVTGGAALLAELARDPGPALRRRAVVALGRSRAPLEERRPPLSIALDDPDGVVRLEAVRALALLGRDALPGLTARLSDELASPLARAGAARAIGRISGAPIDPSAARALALACAPTEEGALRQAAADALRAWKLEPPAGSPAAAALDDEDRALFAWFDGLGFPSLEGRALVLVPEGGWGRGRDAREAVILLEDGAKEARVLGLDLGERRIRRADEQEDALVSAPRDLTRTAEETIAAIRSAREAREEAERDLREGRRPRDPDALSGGRFGERISQRAELFVLARLCAANGAGASAHALVAAARAVPSRDRGMQARERAGRPAGDLRELLEADIGHAEMWRAVLAFGDPEVPRATLLRRFRELPERFPSSEHVPRARETAALLEPMVEEDGARAARGPLPEDAPLEARIADLIFELRDQNGRQMSQPGACDIFADPRGAASPAARLVAIGMPAVPALIEVADDPRPTRSVGFHRDFYFSHYVLTTGDCAIAIVQRIAGRPFYERRSTAGAAVKGGEAPGIKAEMRAWWAALSTRGEEGFLRDAVASGDERSPYEAAKLVDRYPASALAAIAEGARKADPRTRAALVTIAGALEGPTATAFLAEELARAPHLSVRVAAARGLHARGDPRAVPAMAAAWRAPPPPDPSAWRGAPRSGDDSLDELNRRDFDERALDGVLGFLAASRDPRAIRALADGLGARPLGVRATVIGAFDPESYFGGSWMAPRAGGPYDAAVVTTAAAEEEIEALLVASLDDEAVRAGWSGTRRDGESFEDARLCDLAACALAARYPERYGFRIGAALARRDREIAMARNAWRRRRGLEPLPVPDLPVPPYVDDATVAAGVRAALDARDEAARAIAVGRLEALGPGAARAIDAQARLLPPDQDGRLALLAAARRLALRVREVRVVAGQGVAPTQAVLDVLRPLEGRPLPARAVVDALLAFARADEPEGRALSIMVERPGDLTGVSIRVAFAQDEPGGGGGTGTLFSSGVEVAGERLCGSNSGLSHDYAGTAKPYVELSEALRKALEASPDQAMSVRASLTRGSR